MLLNGLHYHLETAGTGAPLVLLHGFTGSAANWSDHVPIFARQFRVIAPDLLGHGQTDSPVDPARYRIERAAGDLIALFDALGLPSVDLFGYSMGGRLALYTALAYPQRVARLILESASPGLKTAAERAARVERDEALARRIEAGGIAAFADFWTDQPLFASQPPAVRERLRAQRLKNNAVGLANSLRGMGTGAQPSLWDRLAALDIATLLICGALDAKFSAINAEMHALAPASSLTVLPGAGHTPHVEQPERFRQAILAR